MPLHSINGHYNIQHSQPDGDSIHFHSMTPPPSPPSTCPPQVHADGGLQLRREAIDALETHHSPRVHGGFSTPATRPGLRRPAAAGPVGFTDVVSLAVLDDQLVIMLKPSRRLVDYLALGAGSISLAGFGAFPQPATTACLSFLRGTPPGSTTSPESAADRAADLPTEGLIFIEG